MTQNFVHLHNHSHHGSILDGYGTADEMCKRAAELGMPGIGISDHGMMSGAYELDKSARKYGINGIVGIEAYAVPGDAPMTTHEPIFFGSGAGDNKEERSNDVSGRGAYTHLTMFAETNEGMHNLFRLNSLAFKYGNYRKPRIDVDTIAEYSKGVIASTGCPSGELQTRLRLGQWNKALAYASKMQDIFGKDNYFLELMDHNMSIDLERSVRGDLMKIAQKLEIPLLATNDAHYVTKNDALSHEHMLAINSGSLMSEPTYENGGKRFAFSGEEYYLKTAEEMAQIFGNEDVYPGAMSNTLVIAERCNTSFEYNPNLRPNVPLPEGHDEDSFLRQEAFEGLRNKVPHKANDPEYIERLEKELAVFKQKNFSGYMLVVSDFMRWSKRQGWQVGAARGSGGGSLLAYVTDITEIDPIPHKLIFERFLNPERDSPPDIDSDFDDVNREKVMQYVRDKYGEETVAMIITFGKLKAKNSIKDITRIFNEPYSTGEALTKLIPAPVSGFDIAISQILDPDNQRYVEGESFRELMDEDPASKRIVEAALGLEGRIRSTGVHAAGVIMSSKPLIDVIPLMTRKEDGVTITQFDYPTCEDLGLIKMDFLGIRNLTVVDKTIQSIKKNHGVLLDSTKIYESVLTTHDEKTYALLRAGYTLGIFQLDSPPIAALLKAMKVDTFEDISAVIALYRPGPMGMNSHNIYVERKTGVSPVEPIHPELAEVLKDILAPTYGVICYQEQVMAIAQAVAGYTLGAADTLRRIMGKKKKKDLDAEYPVFASGMKTNGYSDAAVEVLWNTLIPFAEYGFNKSHSAGYGLLTYLTAYLKAHYPAEFMAANLSTLTKDQDKTAIYLEECRRMGIKVLPPSVSRSSLDYTPISDTEILVGLQAIRGVGAGVSHEIMVEAEKKEYESVEDFVNRVPGSVLNKGVLEGLSLAGALDGFGYSRRALKEGLPTISKSVINVKKKEDLGQFSLFDDVEDDIEEPISSLALEIPHLPEYTKKDKLALERHYLGLYVSDHPLSGVASSLDKYADTKIASIIAGDVVASSGGFGDRKKITLAGVANSVVKKPTKNGDMMARFTLEDMTGTIPALIFPKGFGRLGHKLEADNIYVMTGSILQRDGEDPSFAVDSLEEIELTPDGLVPFVINLREDQINSNSMSELAEILQRHKGDMPVFLQVRKEKTIEIMELGKNYGISAESFGSGLIRREVMGLFGVDCLD